MGNLHGIDVSSFQGFPVWSKVKAAGIDFAYIKACEGVGAPDKGFDVRASGAFMVGLKTGFYHFATLNKPQDVEADAKSEAVFFAGLIHNRKSSLPPVLDIEANPGNLTPTEVVSYINTFISMMKSLGYPETVIYSYTPFLDQYVLPGSSLGNNKLWIAQYTKAPSPSLPKAWHAYYAWQYTDAGVVDGINGKVDMNLMAA